MKKLLIALMALPFAATAYAQSTPVSGYVEADDIKVVDAKGARIGEIETVLLDGTGKPAAMVVEINDGFMGLGDKDVVVTMDALKWMNGQYAVDLTEEQMKNLPVWDD